MTEAEKYITLSKLYALRAGLSAIAEEKDGADKVYQTYEDKKTSFRTEQQQFNEQIAACGSELNRLADVRTRQENEVKKLDSQSDSRYQKTQQLQEAKEKLQQEIKERSHDSRYICKCIFFVLMIISCVLSVLSMLLAIGIDNGEGFMSFTAWLIFLGASLVCALLFTILFFVFKSKSYWSGKGSAVRYRKQEIAKLTDEINGSQPKDMRAYNDLLRQIEELKEKENYKRKERKIAELEAEKISHAVVAETKKQREDVSIMEHVAAGRMIFDGLKAEFSKFLDERDWENVDYVIYVLETGRADSMKEALQLVDRERQTDRIVTSVQDAAYTVSDTIRTGLRDLSGAMSQCFSALSSQMREVKSTLGVQQNMIGKLGGGMENLAGQARLLSALQKKSNETSIAIMRDVRAIRDNSDYADWRLRNN